MKKDDLVQISMTDTVRSRCFDGSPAINLEGSVCKIKEVKEDGAGKYYTLKMIELHAKDPSAFDEFQLDMTWRDKHLVSFIREEIDIMSVYEVENERLH